MELHARLILALLAILVLGGCILFDDLRVKLGKRKKRHRLTISISMLRTTTVIYSKKYRYQWLAVLAAWWHRHNLPNLKPFEVQTKIEESYE